MHVYQDNSRQKCVCLKGWLVLLVCHDTCLILSHHMMSEHQQQQRHMTTARRDSREPNTTDLNNVRAEVTEPWLFCFSCSPRFCFFPGLLYSTHRISTFLVLLHFHHFLHSRAFQHTLLHITFSTTDANTVPTSTTLFTTLELLSKILCKNHYWIWFFMQIHQVTTHCDISVTDNTQSPVRHRCIKLSISCFRLFLSFLFFCCGLTLSCCSCCFIFHLRRRCCRPSRACRWQTHQLLLSPSWHQNQ